MFQNFVTYHYTKRSTTLSAKVSCLVYESVSSNDGPAETAAIPE